MRHDLDRYDSPFWYMTAIAEYLPLANMEGSVILEPCKGSGIIEKALKHILHDDCVVITNDIDLDVIPCDFHHDATSYKLWKSEISKLNSNVLRQYNLYKDIDWVITNPPFNKAFPIIQDSYRYAKKGMVFFLRSTWYEPCDNRAEWLHEHPYTRRISLPRFCFRKDGKGRWATDATNIDAYVWEFESPNDRGRGKRSTNLRRSRSIPKVKINDFYSNPDKIPDHVVAILQKYE